MTLFQAVPPHVVDQRDAYNRFDVSAPLVCSVCGLPVETLVTTECGHCGADFWRAGA